MPIKGLTPTVARPKLSLASSVATVAQTGYGSINRHESLAVPHSPTMRAEVEIFRYLAKELEPLRVAIN